MTRQTPHGELTRLAPQIQAFFEAAPKEPLDFLTVQEQRQLIRHLSDLNYLRFGRRAEPVAAVTDLTVPVDGGEITVRAYRPDDQAPLPAHIELHGGGWWLGSIDEHVNEAICRYRCVHAHCVGHRDPSYRGDPRHQLPDPRLETSSDMAARSGNDDQASTRPCPGAKPGPLGHSASGSR